MADLSEMPLMHKLEPKPSKGGQRRLRRCYAAFLPAEDKTGPSVLAGLFAGADVSYQARFPDGLNPTTQRAEDPAIFEVAPMLVYSPMGPSGYDRPQLRAVFRAAHLNQGAIDQYVPDDPRHSHDWVYFVGVQAEWWFNSSTYR